MDLNPRRLLAERGLAARKRWGQNFLLDAGAAARIAQAAVAGESALPVLEIGPGTGTLTRALLDAGADLTAVEIDRGLVDLLRERPDLAGARIVEGDILAYDLAGYAARSGRWAACGNLPYYITTPILFALLECEPQPERIVVMVQREVADRLTAQPGAPAYGSLSVVVAYRARVSRLLTLKPAAFFPRPQVDSAVVVLERHGEPPVHPKDPERMLRLVRAAFAYRRKTLANALELANPAVPRARTAAALAAIGKPLEARGESLSLNDFSRLSDELA
ncbi:MAG TPA: 16S rRNA (adenine(1518)-N(6)/adenine(1519)-N(6))-dimethyltransferase RsmA [Candidatus Dormibacteraeota bacterium]|nr:16S rRNA (adenine(1518)-N(6)/adenine(1519)-N(6))-dimethyltransferase RsmA [Candidatus Dormibacteraeota bacterium]